MKRLFVKPEFRSLGIGKTLTLKSIEYARDMGYKAMRLDTISVMKEAISIYKKYGFEEIPYYRFNPFPDAVFMEKKL
jgi:ribosomal protein S18 acetylase RimI-like enzyme